MVVTDVEPLAELEPGMPIVFGGNRVTRVPSELADAFAKGDRLVVVQDTGDLLHIPADEWLTTPLSPPLPKRIHRMSRVPGLEGAPRPASLSATG